MQIYFPKAQLDLVYIMMICLSLGNSNYGNHMFTDTKTGALQSTGKLCKSDA